MRTLFAIPFIFFGIAASDGQTIEDFAAKYAGENGAKYLAPLAETLGAGLNSGFFHSAKIPRMGFTFDLSVVASVAFIPEEDRTFRAVTTGYFYPPAAAEAPTILGSAEPAVVYGAGGTSYAFPGGLDIKRLPLVIPQVKIGAILGTEASARFFAADINDRVGRLDFIGLGVRHSLSQYLGEDFPVDIAAGYYWQTLQIGDFSELRVGFINLQASHNAGLLTLYGGGGYSATEADFTYNHEGASVNLRLRESSDIRWNLGAALEFGALYVGTDVNAGDRTVWSTSVGVAL